MLDGSPPCQGFSTSGKRKMSDPRNSLFMEFCRLLKGLKPKVFVVENVTGMVKGHMKQVFLDIMKTLRECGYDCVAQVMNAKWYGVPQARQRVIIIGTRKDLKKPPGHPNQQPSQLLLLLLLTVCQLMICIYSLPRWLKNGGGYAFR